ncbi:hypothetical protein [Desulfomonile tiedjei]|uniref:hypothetical protein n=1 Tax=Desulfomonile tiedjei TaxID=2358 RepID=UPI0002E25384|nr:hypothetical protein [Desulfomonile tiedjei]
MRRFAVVSLLVFSVLTLCMGNSQAEVLSQPGVLDSSFRIEFLFGTQSFSYSGATSIRGDFNIRVPLLAGTVELSPSPLISGRFAGAISIFERSGSMMRDPNYTGLTDFVRWQVEPDLGSWEFAGLYHLWTGGGYRYSIVAGYRQETWRHRGEAVNSEGRSRDEFASQIPFLGLQTSMFFPWWKARFEVLGSPFMTRRVSNSLQERGQIIDYSGELSQGGLLEFQMEGNVAVTQNIWCGLHARYLHQELRGDVSGTINDVPTGVRVLSVADSIVTVGVDFTLLF